MGLGVGSVALDAPVQMGVVIGFALCVVHNGIDFRVAASKTIQENLIAHWPPDRCFNCLSSAGLGTGLGRRGRWPGSMGAEATHIPINRRCVGGRGGVRFSPFHLTARIRSLYSRIRPTLVNFRGFGPTRSLLWVVEVCLEPGAFLVPRLGFVDWNVGRLDGCGRVDLRAIDPKTKRLGFRNRRHPYFLCCGLRRCRGALSGAIPRFSVPSAAGSLDVSAHSPRKVFAWFGPVGAVFLPPCMGEDRQRMQDAQ